MEIYIQVSNATRDLLDKQQIKPNQGSNNKKNQIYLRQPVHNGCEIGARIAKKFFIFEFSEIQFRSKCAFRGRTFWPFLASPSWRAPLLASLVVLLFHVSGFGSIWYFIVGFILLLHLLPI